MDFTILTNKLPSDRIASYKLPDLNLENNLVETVNKAGFHSSIIHPFRITYFDRDLVLNRLPFENTIFSENMHDYLGLELDNKAVNVYGFEDEDMFQISKTLFERSSAPQFHYLISWRTHWPFKLNEEIFETNARLHHDKPLSYDYPLSTWEKYYHSVLYLDSHIERYIDLVPEGTRFYIFGDHEAPLQFPAESGFTKKANTKPEYVPLILWQKGCDKFPDSVNKNTKGIHVLELSDHLNYYFRTHR